MRQLIRVAGLTLLAIGIVFPVFATGDREAAADRPVEITYWEMMWGPAETYTAAAESLVERFNELHPNVNVNLQMTPWSNFYQTFLTAITSGAAPDVSTGAFPQAVQYAEMGEILFLDSIVEEWRAENNPILQDFIPGGLELHQYEGRQAGIPWNSDPRMIHYRTDVFEQLGITEYPTTWDEFIKVAVLIRDNTDMIPLVFPVADQGGTQTLLNYLFTNGVGFTTSDIQASFTDRRVVETLRFFGRLYAENLIPEGIVSYVGADAQRLYLSGRAAMYHSAPLQAVFDYPEVEAHTRVMPPIHGPNGIPRNLTWLNSMMAYQQTDNPDAAKALVKWWSENNLPLWTDGRAGPFPARLSYMENRYFQDKWLTRQIAERILPTSVPPVWPAEVLYPQFAQIEGENFLAIALQDVVSGRTDYEAIARRVNTMIVNALAE